MATTALWGSVGSTKAIRLSADPFGHLLAVQETIVAGPPTAVDALTFDPIPAACLRIRSPGDWVAPGVKVSTTFPVPKYVYTTITPVAVAPLGDHAWAWKVAETPGSGVQWREVFRVRGCLVQILAGFGPSVDGQEALLQQAARAAYEKALRAL